MNIPIILMPQNRTVLWGEDPKKATADVGGKRPKSTRHFWVSGATDMTEAILAFAQVAPRTDVSVDLTTSAAIMLFMNNIAPREMGGGMWEATVTYESSSDTIDLSFTLGTQSIKIQQALADVASYNCVASASAATTAALAAALAARVAADALIAGISADRAAASVLRTTAVASAAVVGVEPGVMGLCDQANVAALDALNAIILALTRASSGTAALTNCRVGVVGGDLATAAAEAALLQARLPQVAAAIVAAGVASAIATDKADQAVIASGGGNAQTITAASDAEACAVAIASIIDPGLPLLETAMTACAATTAPMIAAATADIAPGGNGVPNTFGAIGINGDTVEGVEIEVGKVEFSITKKWNLTDVVTFAPYMQTLVNMLGGYRTPVNDATWSFTWMGITLVFPRGTVSFRGWPLKWNSQNECEISYHFSYERSITVADNFRVGNSGIILKEGKYYGWARYKAIVSGGQQTPAPQSFHVQQVYPYADFNQLLL